MKTGLLFLFILLGLNNSFGQHLRSGTYDLGMLLAYDEQTGKVTGCFEGYNGWDEESKSPKFSCVFYLEGNLNTTKIPILTYYQDPEVKFDDTITGTLEVHTDTTVEIFLPSEHGGCWNVQHFADEPLSLELVKKENWSAIKYVTAAKAYFYAEKLNDKIKNAYVVKNDFVCVEKSEGDWIYCYFYGEKMTSGWMKRSDVNE